MNFFLNWPNKLYGFRCINFLEPKPCWLREKWIILAFNLLGLILCPGLGGGVLPYMGYIGMCGPKGYGFSAVLVINRVSILANFGHFGHKWGMVFAL